MNNTILFSETQKFKQWWIWLVLLGLNGIAFFGVYSQVILGKQFGNQPMSDTGIIIVAGLTLMLTLIFFLFRLETQIKADGIYVKFFPFQLSFKHYSWESITKCAIRQYNPIGEYGGWGFRGFRKNKALNVSGNKGLQLEFSDGKKLLIGTNKPEELKEVLDKIIVVRN